MDLEECVTSFQSNADGNGLSGELIPARTWDWENPLAMNSILHLKAPQGFEDTDAYSPPDDVHCLSTMFLNDVGENEGVIRGGIEDRQRSFHKDVDFDHNTPLQEPEMEKSISECMVTDTLLDVDNHHQTVGQNPQPQQAKDAEIWIVDVPQGDADEVFYSDEFEHQNAFYNLFQTRLDSSQSQQGQDSKISILNAHQNNTNTIEVVSSEAENIKFFGSEQFQQTGGAEISILDVQQNGAKGFIISQEILSQDESGIIQSVSREPESPNMHVEEKLQSDVRNDANSKNTHRQAKMGDVEDASGRLQELGRLNQAASHVRSSQSERTHDRSKRPGVILLGRGNSFSLGRSEVLVLHGSKNSRKKGNTNQSSGNRKNKSDKNRDSKIDINEDDDKNNSKSINKLDSEKDIEDANSSCRDNETSASKNGGTLRRYEETLPENSELSGHPPALSNTNLQSFSSEISRPAPPRAIRIATSPSGHLTNGFGRKNGVGLGNGTGTLSSGCHFETKTEVDDELELLWRKAERIMAQKRSVVETILEDFGISNVGGETYAEGGHGYGEDNFDVDDEEESVWQAVQNNFRS